MLIDNVSATRITLVDKNTIRTPKPDNASEFYDFLKYFFYHFSFPSYLKGILIFQKTGCMNISQNSEGKRIVLIIIMIITTIIVVNEN